MGTLSSLYPDSLAVESSLDRANSAAHDVSILNSEMLEVLARLLHKQDTLSVEQLAAVNSGITSELVSQIGLNESDIASLQSNLSNFESATQGKLLEDYLRAYLLNYETGLTNSDLSDVVSGTIESFTITGDNHVYDFQDATINHLTIGGVGNIVKNFRTTNTITVSSGSRNCIISNARFRGSSQAVTFGNNTWAYLFDNCSFVSTVSSGGTKVKCMNAGLRTNDTVILSNCYFYNFKSVIECGNDAHINIIGGWCDSCDYVIYGSSYVNISASLSNFDAESVTSVFKFAGGTNASLEFGGQVAAASNGIVDFNSGCVNLFYRGTISSTTVPFSSTSPKTRYCNIPYYNECAYPFSPLSTVYKIPIVIPPHSVVQPFTSKIHVQSADCLTSYINIYINGSSYTKGSTYNGVVDLKLENTSEYWGTFNLILNTQNRLNAPLNE